MKKLIILSILLISTNAAAVAYTSASGGNWSNPATWGGGGFPGVGDSATIQAGHKVYVDGNISVGTSPASVATYDLDISGWLVWTKSPGASWTMNVYSSIRVNSGGIFLIGEDASNRLDCSYTAEVVMNTAPANQKYGIYLNGGSLRLYGCENYTGGTTTRARIESCAPDCTAGARVVTLDETEGAIAWNNSGAWAGDAVLFGIGGNPTTAPGAGDDPEYVSTWLMGAGPGGTVVMSVTFTENHQPGDIVENVSRNILFRSNSATYHSRVYTASNFSDAYDISWAMFKEFGDSTSSGFAAINFTDQDENLGSIYYTVLLDCDDGASAGGFYMGYDSATRFDNNVVHDTGGTSAHGFSFYTALEKDGYVLDSLSYYGGTGANGAGFYTTGDYVYSLTNFWASHGSWGVYENGGAIREVSDSLIHGTTTDGIYILAFETKWYGLTTLIKDNEIYNSGGNAIESQHVNLILENNELIGANDSCFYGSSTSMNYNIRAYNNTYDNCNIDNNDAQSGFEMKSTNFVYYGYNEEFGNTTVNKKSNVLLYPATGNTGSNARYVCNNCLFGAPSNALSCGNMDSDGIYLYNCSAGGYAYAIGLSDDTYLSLHNKDQVAGTHATIGPGGSWITRETGTVVDNTLNVKVMPGDARDYNYIELGKTYATAGDPLSVSVQIRKNEAIAEATGRPRLALEGAGFVRDVDYAVIPDNVDTWNTVTVSSPAVSSSNVVHIYLAVKNKLSGADDYTPVWPSTLEIFCDGISVSH